MFRSFIGVPLASLFLLAGSSYSQPANLTGPLAGFVYDPATRSVRPMFGIPGATYTSSPVLSDVDLASVAPSGKSAFFVKGGQAGFIQDISAAISPAPTDGLISSVDRIVWSRNGQFALLYSSSGNQLQRVAVSSKGVAADTPIDLSSLGQATALTIDPTGQQIVFGVSGSGLYLATPSQSPALLSSMANPVAAAFDDSGVNLYAADLGQQQIVTFQSGSGPIPFASLTRADGTASTPVGLGLSAGSRYLLAADSATRSVLVYDTGSQNLVNTIPLDFSPSRFDALSTGPSFLLNGDRSNEWLLILDARQTPAVYFVPATQEQL
jgi:hypothetical protein